MKGDGTRKFVELWRQLLAGPVTIRDVSALLGISEESARLKLSMLEQANAIRIVGTRPAESQHGGRPAWLYGLTDEFRGVGR